jgi:chemotaxis protein MotB
MKFPFLQSFGILILTLSLFSCVPANQLKDLQKKCLDEQSELKRHNEDLTLKNDQQTTELAKLTNKIQLLINDTTTMGESLRKIKNDYTQLSQTCELLSAKNRELNSGDKSESKQILAELQTTQENLFKKEDELKKLEQELRQKKENLDKLSGELQQKQQKLTELQSILNRQDSIMNNLKKKVADALLGFEGKGLTVQRKNGKVYVSLEEKLLFASGKYDVSKEGADALKKLAKVLENNTDINVLIEGHTDNVPYTGAGQLKDNWDLSVMRATAIVKIILENDKIDPKRLSASGRSEYLPVETGNTPEARAKNRRTEIILTPKLDELLKIIETN